MGPSLTSYVTTRFPLAPTRCSKGKSTHFIACFLTAHYRCSRQPTLFNQWIKSNRHSRTDILRNMAEDIAWAQCGDVFRRCPTGNSPELMPLDASLNNDVHTCVDMHDVHPQPKIRRPWLRNEVQSAHGSREDYVLINVITALSSSSIRPYFFSVLS